MNAGWAAGVLAGLLSWPLVAGAVALSLPPAAKQTSERISPFDGYDLPVAGFADGVVPSESVEGRVVRRTWRIDSASPTSMQIFQPLRDQLVQAGYDLVFECHDQTCGGFDFRFGTEIVPAPDMHVDIRDFRFVAARRGPDHVASLLVSKSRNAAFVQAIFVDPRNAPEPEPVPVVPTQDPEDADSESIMSLSEQLWARGHVVLNDLAFAPGGSKLEDRTFPSLEQLAAFLDTHPDAIVVLVGHTDTVGSLSNNILLSKRRAQVVRTRLIDSYGADPNRVQAEGNGYLSPMTTNLTPEGRETNRRVEAILLN